MGIEKVGLPRIATGPGKLDWPQARSVIESVAAITPVMLTVFKL